jgi:hypothetical protein
MSKYTYVVRQFNGAQSRRFTSLEAAKTWARSHAVLRSDPIWNESIGATVWLGYYSRADAIRCWAFPPPSLRLRIERHKRT